MAKRKSRRGIEDSYRKVYGVKGSLGKNDDRIMNRALSEVRQYEGKFPGEGNEKSIADNREQDVQAVAGDPSTLVRYFRQIGLANGAESDWDVIFRLHRDFINPSTKKTVEELERMSRPEEVATKQAEEPVLSDSPVVEESTPSSSDIQTITTKKEENPMAENMNIGQAMGGNIDAAAQNAMNLAAQYGGATGGAMNLNTNVGEATLSDREKALAEQITQQTADSRKAWTDSNKIKYFVITNMPLKDRVGEGVTTGVIRDPANQLKNIVKTVWKDATPQEGLNWATGKIGEGPDSQIPVPPSVMQAASAEAYKEVITILNEAVNNGNNVLELKLDGKLSGFRGVVVQQQDGTASWLMPEVKKQIIENGLAMLTVEGTDSVQMQLKVISSTQIANMKKRKGGNATTADMVQLQVPGRDKLVDLKENMVIDASRVKFYNTPNPDNTKAALDSKYNAYSKVSFQYQKKVKDTRPGAAADAVTARNFTKRIILDVVLREVIPSSDPEMQAFQPKRGVGVSADPLTSAQALDVVKAIYEQSLPLASTGDANLDKMRADLKMQESRDNAELAAQAAGNDML